MVEAFQIFLSFEVALETFLQLQLNLCFLLLPHRVHVGLHIFIDILYILADNILLPGLALANDGVDAALLALSARPALELNKF